MSGGIGVAGNVSIGGRINVMNTGTSMGIGYNALPNTGANNNTAIGYNSLYQNVTGTDNTAVGYTSLLENKAPRNVAIGAYSLCQNVTGTDNTAVGYNSLRQSTGHYNLAVGASSLTNMSSGSNNLAIGYASLSIMSSGDSNIAIGAYAGISLTYGSHNIIIGYDAQLTNGTDYEIYIYSSANCYLRITTATATLPVALTILGATASTSTGTGALLLSGANAGIGLGGNIWAGGTINASGFTSSGNVNITSTTASTSTGTGALIVSGGIGVAGNVSIGGRIKMMTNTSNMGIGYNALPVDGGSNNTAFGYNSLYANTDGYENTAFGSYSLYSNTGNSTVRNTAFGSYSLYSNQTGSNNTAIGYIAGSTLLSGSNNTMIGYNAQPTTTATSNEIYIYSNADSNLRITETTATLPKALRIQGTTTSTSTTSGSLILSAAGAGIGLKGNIWAGGTINGSSFNATSDARIKHEICDISNNSSLDLLRQIQPKSFKYVDKTQNNDESVYGFIAQEVRQVLPKAVQIESGCVPTIYEMAVVDKYKITLTDKSTNILKITDRIRMLDISENEITATVTGIIDDKSFIIDKSIPSEAKTMSQCIFIYGVYVNDFHMINKDTIWTIVLAATKELDTQLQEARATIRQLNERLTALERKEPTVSA